MKTVTMLEFRKDASRVLRWLTRETESVRLTYRGRPVAIMVPASTSHAKRPPHDDPFYRLAEKAAKGATLTNEEIDRIVYEQA
jgi:antitoxin (DNA-binding transcriptional repressor) of toxin-antitoxin stability system